MTENGFMEGLRLGRGCEYGRINSEKIHNLDKEVAEMKVGHIDMKKDIRWIMIMIFVLLFVTGGDLAVKLLAFIK